MTPISEVWLGDNMEYMANFPDGYFNLAVVDPEYGIDVANMNMGAGLGKKCSKIKNRKWKSKNWDKSTPDNKYFEELFRVSKNQIIWGGNYFGLPAFKHYIVWDKQIPEGLSFSDCELAWTSFDKSQRIFRYSAYLDKSEKMHPTQKSVNLYRWLFKNYATAGDKILDTHLGSGSSRIAAYKMGFDFYSCEIDEEYFNKSNERFLKAIDEPLFKPVVVTQKDIFQP